MDSKWTNEDKKNIMAVFSSLAMSLKSYGATDHRQRLKSWEMIMGSETTGEQICAAMLAHAKKSDEIPTPADLLKIINPPPAKISVSEYNHAREMWKAEGYKSFCYWKGVMDDFEKQQSEENDVPSYKQILERREQWRLEGRKAIGHDSSNS